MARLAALEAGAAPRAYAREARSPRRRSAAFGLGLAAGAIVGSATLLVLALVDPGHLRAGAGPARQPETALAETTALPVERSFSLLVSPGERARAAFPLRFAGAADSLSVIFRDVPESTWLSTGERQDEHTWLLRPADLDGLYLRLREGTPESFDLTVVLADAGGAELVRTVARVQLAGAGEPHKAAPASIDELLQRAEPASLPRNPAQAVSPARSASKSAGRPDGQPAAGETSTRAVAAEAERGPQTSTVAKPRPEGMSALGALAREPAPEARQLWWKMPLPDWAPFEAGAGRR
jgi:hypothetical protein